MRLAVALALAALAGGIPYAFGRPLALRGSPRALIVVAATAIASMAAASIVLLGSVVGSAAVPTRTLPTLVERCVGAAGQLLQHPVQHWPRIIAALLLLAILARAVWAICVISRAARRQRMALLGLPSSISAHGGHIVIASDRPFAFTSGAFSHHDVFISQGLIDRLSPEALGAVLAHEQAHATGRHGALHLIGVAAARAFVFLPPMRAAADQLVLGLELLADRRALAKVDDPTVLAMALINVAEHTKDQPAGTLAASVTSIATRIRRLTEIAAARPPDARPLLGQAAVLISTATLFVLLAALPISARNFTGTARAEAAHAVCHLPQADE